VEFGDRGRMQLEEFRDLFFYMSGRRRNKPNLFKG